MNKKIKVLIADDNIYFSNFLKEYLEKISFIEVLGVANTDAQEIILIEKLKPDIVITDIIRNDKLSGLDIIKTYKKEDKNIKFLVLSAYYNDNSIIGNEREKLVDGHLSKLSLNLDTLVEELKRINDI